MSRPVSPFAANVCRSFVCAPWSSCSSSQVFLLPYEDCDEGRKTPGKGGSEAADTGEHLIANVGAIKYAIKRLQRKANRTPGQQQKVSLEGFESLLHKIDVDDCEMVVGDTRQRRRAHSW